MCAQLWFRTQSYAGGVGECGKRQAAGGGVVVFVPVSVLPWLNGSLVFKYFPLECIVSILMYVYFRLSAILFPLPSLPSLSLYFFLFLAAAARKTETERNTRFIYLCHLLTHAHTNTLRVCLRVCVCWPRSSSSLSTNNNNNDNNCCCRCCNVKNIVIKLHCVAHVAQTRIRICICKCICTCICICICICIPICVWNRIRMRWT